MTDIMTITIKKITMTSTNADFLDVHSSVLAWLCPTVYDVRNTYKIRTGYN